VQNQECHRWASHGQSVFVLNRLFFSKFFYPCLSSVATVEFIKTEAKWQAAYV